MRPSPAPSPSPLALGAFVQEHGRCGHLYISNPVLRWLAQPPRPDLRRPPDSWRTTPSRLARAASEPALRYELGGESDTLDDYLARNAATGLLIAHGDTILVERYQYARRGGHRFTSHSMAETVTAMLVGIAIAEERIRG